MTTGKMLGYAAALLLLLAAAVARAEDRNAILAVYNGKAVTYSDIRAQYEYQVYGIQMQAARRWGSISKMPEDKRRAVEMECYRAMAALTRQEILKRLILDEGEKRGILPFPEEFESRVEAVVRQRMQKDPDTRNLTAFAKANGISEDTVFRSLLGEETAAIVVRRLVREPDFISPAAIRNYYDRHMADWFRPERVQLRVIKLPYDVYGRKGAAEKANEIMERLRKGESFAALAKEFSKGSKAAQGGLWEIRETSSYNAVIRNALAKISDGQTAEPLMLRSSVMIIKLEKRFPAGPKPFEEVRLDIKKKLEEESLVRKRKEWVTTLYEQATVRYVDPLLAKIISEWEAEDETTGKGGKEGGDAADEGAGKGD